MSPPPTASARRPCCSRSSGREGRRRFILRERFTLFGLTLPGKRPTLTRGATLQGCGPGIPLVGTRRTHHGGLLRQARATERGVDRPPHRELLVAFPLQLLERIVC